MPAPWLSPLLAALDRQRDDPAARFVAVATVRGDGRPANRTLVWRGFPGEQPYFPTDARSAKAAEVAANAWAEACWYFAAAREQFRLAGRLRLVTAADIDPADLRRAAWRELSDAARQSFTWPPPGRPRADAAAFAA